MFFGAHSHVCWAQEYDLLLKSDPTYAPAWRRKVAMCKADGDVSSAIVGMIGDFSVLCCGPYLASQKYFACLCALRF
jgi:hypothetical protein